MAVTTMPHFTIAYNKSINGGYYGRVIEIGGCYSQGKTIEELKENLKDALNAILQYTRITGANDILARSKHEGVAKMKMERLEF